MLAGQVTTPVNREFKLVSFSNGLFQDLNTFGIRQTDKFRVYNLLQTFYQAFVHHLVQELQVIGTIVKRPFHTELNEFFFQIHQLGQISKGNFWLYHPELSQMARSIRVFCTESRTECINRSQCRCSKFTLQLTRNSQTGLLAEEVIVVNNGTILIFLQVIKVLGCHLEHLTSTLAIRRRNNRRVEVEETFLMEESMNSDSHIVANTKYGAKGIGTRTQVGNLTQELHRVSFLLQRISIVTCPQYFYFTSLNFCFLTSTDRFSQHTVHAQTSSRRDILQ